MKTPQSSEMPVRFSRLCIPWLIQGTEQYGVRSATLYLTKALRECGVDAPMISIADGPFTAECRERGMEVVPLHAAAQTPLAGSLLAKARRVLQVRREQRTIRSRLAAVLAPRRIDALHFRWPNMVAIAGPVARRLGVPAFWQMPNYVGTGYPLGINRLYYQASCYANGIVPLANSRYTAATLGNLLVEPRVFHLAADDEDRFNPVKVRSRRRSDLGIPDDATVLGIVARIDPSKGQRRVLEAMLRLVAEGQNLYLLLLGGPTDGPEAAELKRLVAVHGAIERLRFAGQVPDPEAYYDAIDIAINSRVDAEPFGLSVVEAMLMHRPVLVHALGGPAETVVDGVSGWHVFKPDVDSFERGLRRALADRPRWPQMREESRRHALEHFSSSRQAKRYLDIVKAVLIARPPKRVLGSED